jgi:flagellar protein FlgJ
MTDVHPGVPGRDPLSALREGRIQGPEARLRAATRLLEGTFYQELFKAMRQTVPDGGGPGGGAGEEVFTGLLDQHVADAAAMRAERGLGEALYRRFASAAGAGVQAVPPALDAPGPPRGET